MNRTSPPNAPLKQTRPRFHPLWALALGLPVLAAVGCGSPAKRVEPGGPGSVTTVGQIDPQDFSDAGRDMVESLLTSGVFANNSPQNPAVLVISRITNDTTQRIDTDRLIKKIRVPLLKSGKVQVSMTEGLGPAEDPLVKRNQDLDEFLNDEEGQAQTKAENPGFSLSGKLLEQTQHAGDTRQRTFVFQLSLTNPKTGLSVWEDEKRIAKVGTRSAVGW